MTVTVETIGGSVVMASTVVKVMICVEAAGWLVTHEVITQSLPVVREFAGDVVEEFVNCPKNYEC